MKSQKGFTLIELLLVLAIIGIISAIAIPALLGQRARARDKSAQENATSILSDIVATYDKAKEVGADVSTPAALTLVCTVGTGMTPVVPQIPQLLDAKNPWNGTVPVPLAYAPAVVAIADGLPATIRGMSTAADLGQVQMGFLAPNPATAAPGTVATSVYLQGTFTDPVAGVTHIFYKVGNVD
ncbi:MAG: type II secretion system protein [Geothrix sp.]|nr:type II secretion system protein [Geothrix sp.]